MFLISYQNIVANAQAPTVQYRETNFSGDAIKRHSVMFLDSDSEGNEKNAPKTVNKETSGLEFFDGFKNKFTKATEGERLLAKSLKLTEKTAMCKIWQKQSSIPA